MQFYDTFYCEFFDFVKNFTKRECSAFYHTDSIYNGRLWYLKRDDDVKDRGYDWKEYDLTVWDDEQRMIRGLTVIPDPDTSGKEVLIGFRFFPEAHY